MKLVLFDVDGTLVNTKRGITTCAQYALAQFGIEEPDLDKLLFFIGPPLVDTFQKHYGFDLETAKAAVAKYRERYAPVGIFECELYPGVEDTLKSLKEQGYIIGTASSKPEESCIRILEHFGIADYFDEVVGATFDGRIDTKIQVLREAIRRMNITDLSEACLIGDTNFDVEGAKEAGIACIGVSYGFGDPKEMQESGAVCVCDTLQEVEEEIAHILGR